jgi:hypothetical protein
LLAKGYRRIKIGQGWIAVEKGRGKGLTSVRRKDKR